MSTLNHNPAITHSTLSIYVSTNPKNPTNAAQGTPPASQDNNLLFENKTSRPSRNKNPHPPGNNDSLPPQNNNPHPSQNNNHLPPQPTSNHSSSNNTPSQSSTSNNTSNRTRINTNIKNVPPHIRILNPPQEPKDWFTMTLAERLEATTHLPLTEFEEYEWKIENEKACLEIWRTRQRKG
ncbi:hypothetical protein KCU65_g6350, partial [Aureobasidium melanogenum]